MDLKTITSLTEHLAVYQQLHPKAFQGARVRPGSNIELLHCPDIGNVFVKTFQEAGISIPPSTLVPELFTAYWYYEYKKQKRYGRNHDMESVESLAAHHGQAYTRAIRALLLCRDLSLEQIANLTSIPLRVLKLYELLHFNVRDRLDEPAYISKLVYGEHTRFNEFDPEHCSRLNAEQLLYRAAVEKGSAEVLFMMGFTSTDPIGSTNADLSNLESESLKFARRLVDYGFLNSPKTPAFHTARHLVNASARKSLATGGVIQPMPGQSLEFSNAMAEELLHGQSPEMKARLKKQAADFEAECKRKGW
jgi:hypothetical protein